MHTESTHLII